MMRAMVIDDEPLARRSVRRFLKAYADVELIGECGDGESAVAAILTKQPDLVFLDVQMPEMDGFEVVRKMGADRMPVTIFVTAYDRYALRAFDETRSITCSSRLKKNASNAPSCVPGSASQEISIATKYVVL